MSTSRRLRATRLRVGGAALASVLLLGGCAAGTHPGAAATIGDQEISVGDLDKNTDAIKGAIGGGQVTPSVVLGLLVDNELALQVVDQRSITVTDAEISEASKVVFEQQVYDKFVANPVTNEFLQRSARALVGRIKLAGGTGSVEDPKAPQENTEGSKVVEEAAKTITIDVAPRYGNWDGTKVDNANGEAGSLSNLSPQSKASQTPDPQQQQQPEQPPAEPQG